MTQVLTKTLDHNGFISNNDDRAHKSKNLPLRHSWKKTKKGKKLSQNITSYVYLKMHHLIYYHIIYLLMYCVLNFDTIFKTREYEIPMIDDIYLLVIFKQCAI